MENPCESTLTVKPMDVVGSVHFCFSFPYSDFSVVKKTRTKKKTRKKINILLKIRSVQDNFKIKKNKKIKKNT